jgi:hypothetical protein
MSIFWAKSAQLVSFPPFVIWYIFGEFGSFLNVDKQASAKCPA